MTVKIRRALGALATGLLLGTGSSFAEGLPPVDLPAGYEQLEYVESTGQQYIDLQVSPDSTMRCSLSFVLNNGITGEAFLFGCRKALQDRAFYLSHQNGSKVGFRFARGDKYVQALNKVTEIVDTYHEVELSAKNAFVLNDDVIGDLSDAAEFANDDSLYLFWVNDPARNLTKGKMQLYSCKLWKGGELVRSLVPARFTDGLGLSSVGVYDLVEGKFYLPEESRTLVAGPATVKRPVLALPPGYTQLDYVSSHGHELLNTKIVPDDTTEMHLRFVPHDTKDAHILGSRKAFQQQAFGLSKNNGLRMAFGTYYLDSWLWTADKEMDVLFCEKQFRVNGVVCSDGGRFGEESPFNGVGPLYVFTVNDNGVPHSQYSNIDLMELAITTNGVSARKFLPAKDAEGNVGLYDFVSSRFITCSQGELTAGPEKPGSIVFSDARYENGALRVTLTRLGALPATDVTFAFGGMIGGDTAAEWEGSRMVGHFNQGEYRIELAVDDLPTTARYGRFFVVGCASDVLEVYALRTPPLPSGYRAVKCVRSDGLRYENGAFAKDATGKVKGCAVDTGYVHKRQTRVECVAEVEKVSLGYSALFGARTGDQWANGGGYAFFVADNLSSVPRYSRSGDKVLGKVGDFPYRTKVKVVTEDDTAAWYAESTGEKLGELTTTALIDDGINSMAIFDLNASPNGGFQADASFAKASVYSFRMIDDGEVSRDFIPCLNEYGEPGFYETVMGKFHGNCRNLVDCDFETDLPTTRATYTWTGGGASADWSDAANWICSKECAAGVPGWSSTVVFPSGSWTVRLDRPLGIRALDLSAANVKLRLCSTNLAAKVLVRSDLTFGSASDPDEQGLWFAGCGMKVAGNLVAAAGASELPLHFVVPKDGYAGAPFDVAGKAFTGSVRGRVYVEEESPALKVSGTTQTALLSSDTDMTVGNVTLEPMPKRHPKRDGSFAWEGAKKLNATLEGCGTGLMLLLF